MEENGTGQKIRRFLLILATEVTEGEDVGIKVEKMKKITYYNFPDYRKEGRRKEGRPFYLSISPMYFLKAILPEISCRI